MTGIQFCLIQALVHYLSLSMNFSVVLLLRKFWQRACVHLCCNLYSKIWKMAIGKWEFENINNTILNLAFWIVWLSFALWWSLNPKIRIGNKFFPVIVNFNFWCQGFVFEYIGNWRFSEGHDTTDLLKYYQLTSLFQNNTYIFSYLSLKTYPRVCLIYLINILMSIFTAQCHQKYLRLLDPHLIISTT